MKLPANSPEHRAKTLIHKHSTQIHIPRVPVLDYLHLERIKFPERALFKALKKLPSSCLSMYTLIFSLFIALDLSQALFAREGSHPSLVAGAWLNSGTTLMLKSAPVGNGINPALPKSQGFTFEAHRSHPFGIDEWSRQGFSFVLASTGSSLFFWTDFYLASEIYGEYIAAVGGSLPIAGKGSSIFTHWPQILGLVYIGWDVQGRFLVVDKTFTDFYPGENLGIIWEPSPMLSLGFSWQDALSQYTYPKAFLSKMSSGITFRSGPRGSLTWNFMQDNYGHWSSSWQPAWVWGKNLSSALSLTPNPFRIGLYAEVRLGAWGVNTALRSHPVLGNSRGWGFYYTKSPSR